MGDAPSPPLAPPPFLVAPSLIMTVRTCGRARCTASGCRPGAFGPPGW